MKRFMGKNFLLDTETARELYHDIAAELPICDFHCHIPVRQIAENEPFTSIAQVWLGADHYKWRAMRVAGVPEAFITGNASEVEKFMAFAETLPKLIGNPLYHWTHLELKRYFNIDEPLSKKTAVDIWNECNERIVSMRPQDLIRKSNVTIVCTTDDPVDSLEWHRRLRAGNDSGANVLPAMRPDKALHIESPDFSPWLALLESAVGYAVSDFETLKRALSLRIEFFHANGCRISDHAINIIPSATPNDAIAQEAFAAFRRDESIRPQLVDAYQSALLAFLSSEYSRLGWTMQFHIGAMRNNNRAMFDLLGPDTGFDAIGDSEIARPLSSLLSSLAQDTPLPRTLLFSINDNDNYTLDALSGAVQKDGVAAHVSPGPAWWFHDSRDGMEKHLRELANTAVLSEFVGMTTDSRSLLSYARHEYFRRIFCNVLGNWVENGEYPEDFTALGAIVRKVCYENAMRLFADVL
ncbi:MAG: glucuronate isomerase [Clostridia bacterium]|nr:glucuronate isomerase [Clostridia bacterium]